MCYESWQPMHDIISKCDKDIMHLPMVNCLCQSFWRLWNDFLLVLIVGPIIDNLLAVMYLVGRRLLRQVFFLFCFVFISWTHSIFCFYKLIETWSKGSSFSAKIHLKLLLLCFKPWYLYLIVLYVTTLFSIIVYPLFWSFIHTKIGK